MSIKIPPAALEAGARAIYLTFTEVNIGDGEDHWERLLPQYRAEYRAQARAAFLAMIEAWPGMRERPFWDFMTGARHIEIILPIPKGLDFIDPLTAQENPDDKA